MKHFVLPVIWAVIILALCSMPGKDIPHISWLEMLAFDKWVHAGVFFILALLLVRAISFAYLRATRLTAIIFTLSVCIPYGGLLEIMQGTIFEERSADIYDFIANSIGAILGVLVYRKLAARIKFFQPK